MNLEKMAEAVAASVGQKLAVVRKSLSQIAGAVIQLDDRVKTLEARAPERGEKGDPGQDAEPVLVADVVAELVKTNALAPLIDLLVAEGVAKHFEANPVQHGKDGRDGKDGEVGQKGDPGADGKPGRDGLDVKDLFRADGGRLMAVMSDGTTKDLGVFVGKDGAPGADGRDGLSVADVTRTYDPEAHEVIERWTVAGEAKELRYPAGGIRPGGFWREGMKSAALQVVTHDGHAWLALRDTAAKPCLENSADWQLLVRKGRDGRDGKDGKPPPGPVKLKGDES